MLQKVVRSTVIDAPIDRVWAVLRDFNSHDQWHDVVAESRIEGGEAPTQVGCIRSFTLKDGNRIREQLLTLSDTELPLDLLHRRGDGAAAALCRDGHVEAGDRWRSHVLALGVDLRDAARHGTRAAPDGRRRRLRGRLREPAPASRPARRCRRRRTRRRCAARCAARSREVRLRRYGGPEQLEIGAGEAAPPGPGEVRIHQRAIGVNYFDIYLRRGWIPALLPVSDARPGVLGMEAAGTVVDVGEGVGTVLPGDRVAYLGPLPGAYGRCAPCRPTGSCGCPRRSRTRPPRRCC